MKRRTDIEVADAVVDLWNGMNGWIPGGAYRELAEVLGVDPDRLIYYDMEAKRRHVPHEHDASCSFGNPTCPAFAAPEARSERGLRYGWWKRSPFLLSVLIGIPGLLLLGFILGQWFGAWSA